MNTLLRKLREREREFGKFSLALKRNDLLLRRALRFFIEIRMQSFGEHKKNVLKKKLIANIPK